jgi:hypothetical protein
MPGEETTTQCLAPWWRPEGSRAGARRLKEGGMRARRRERLRRCGIGKGLGVYLYLHGKGPIQTKLRTPHIYVSRCYIITHTLCIKGYVHRDTTS